MVPRSQIIRLTDILENIDAVAEMFEHVTLDEYKRDVKLRRAVERCIEIISEASRHIPMEMKLQHQSQPWDEIASIGNLLRHHYEHIDDFIMRKIAARSLPQLRPIIVQMLEEAER